MLISGTMPPSAVKQSCMALTAPHEAAVVMTANRARVDDAEADLLALHVAAGQAECVERVVAVRLGPVADATPPMKMIAHDGEDGPALALVADHAAEQLVSAAEISKDRNHLHEIRHSAVGFSNGCAALAFKKPPPLVPSILIAICDATGPYREVCLAPSSVVASI